MCKSPRKVVDETLGRCVQIIFCAHAELAGFFTLRTNGQLSDSSADVIPEVIRLSLPLLRDRLYTLSTPLTIIRSNLKQLNI